MTSLTAKIEAAISTPSDRQIRTAQWWGRGNELVIERFEPERGRYWRFVEHAPDGQHGFGGRVLERLP